MPVVTLDGPSGTGKGTIAALLAEHLGWHQLDSGALYRGLGYAALRAGIDLDQAAELGALGARIDLRLVAGRLLLDGGDISAAIRTESAAAAASRVARHSEVRDALLGWQRAAARPPGLVADGRDMGTVVFPAAPVKFYLDAMPAERALRRYKQLKDKGLDANLNDLVRTLEERDQRDLRRERSPLRAAGDALRIDTTELSIENVFARVMVAVKQRLPDSIP